MRSSWFLGVGVLLLASCVENRVEGPSGRVYGSEVTSFAELNDDGRVTRIVTNVRVSAIERAPTTQPDPLTSDLILEFPDEVVRDTFVQHLDLDFVEQGHPPDVFLVPHFDLHYYRLTPAEVAAIDCRDLTPASPRQVPEGYVLPPPDPASCVPKMGFHAVPESDLAPGAAFDATLILGYYSGSVIFVEPMITRDRLLDRGSFDLDIPAPLELGAPARLPTRFIADYHRSSDSYDFILTDFVEVPGPAL